jgi:hypothetical protein
VRTPVPIERPALVALDGGRSRVPRTPVPRNELHLGDIRPLCSDEREVIVAALASALVSAYRRLYSTYRGSPQGGADGPISDEAEGAS